MSHFWGDDWPHWNDLYKAQNFIYDYVKRWSRCRLMSKEKYGTIRYEWMFPPEGGVYSRTNLQYYWRRTRLYNYWAQFGWYVCGKAIKKAIKKWPHLEEELCCDFLPNTKFGKECKTKYWRKVE